MSNTDFIRKEPRASNGWNGGDIDTAFALFLRGTLEDGDIPSKASRDHLFDGGYIARHNGYQWLTWRGRFACITSVNIWRCAIKFAYRKFRRALAAAIACGGVDG